MRDSNYRGGRIFDMRKECYERGTDGGRAEFVFVSNKCQAREICNIYLHYGNAQSGTRFTEISYSAFLPASTI